MQMSYSRANPLAFGGDALMVPVTSDWTKSALVKALDASFKKKLIKLAKADGFEAKAGSAFVLPTLGRLKVGRVVLWGLGDGKALTAEDLWDLMHKALKTLRSPAVKQLGLLVDFPDGLDPKRVLSKLSQGATCAAYRFDRYITKDRKNLAKADLTRLTFFGDGSKALAPAAAKKAIERGQIIGEGINIARDLVNEPAETMTPLEYAERAKALAKLYGFTCKVENEKQIARRKMGLFMAVARGSKIPPRLLTFTHAPAGAKGKPIVLVGKGLMYDSGGYSLKPSSGMETMKCDMAGSAAVLGAMTAIARLGVKRKVIGIVAACENMIGSGAYRVGDVFTGMNGKTVEVMNTDAEGRLTLADALTYAMSFKPELTVDLATLTGACVVALGEETVGLFASDDETADQLNGAFDRAGEDAWRLPLNKRLKPLLKSPIADLKNVGSRWGGAITAGLFLQEFVETGRWAHLDIAGPAFHTGEVGHLPKGGSGVGVATLLELVDPTV